MIENDDNIKKSKYVVALFVQSLRKFISVTQSGKWILMYTFTLA